MEDRDRDAARQCESHPIGRFRSTADRTILCGSPFRRRPGCLSQSAADGSAAACIDAGPFRYQSPRADSSAVYVIRDLDIVRIAR